MFIRVAMIHCGECLLHTHSPQISLLHLPRPARTGTLHLLSLRNTQLPQEEQEEILIYYNLAETINYARKEDPSFVSAQLIGLMGRVTEGDRVAITTVIDEATTASSAVYPRATVPPAHHPR